ncbi:hypothetical protein TNCV_2492401 [Trichonephila clavipes]|nr:hypothetical protein TNCV_2492401 [Trichonephila clavipes]
MVKILVPLKTRHVEECTQAKSIKDQSPYFGVVWKVEERYTSSGHKSDYKLQPRCLVEVMQSNSKLDRRGVETGSMEGRIKDDYPSCLVVRPTMDWYDDNRVNRLIWPTQRPDLNPVKRFWEDLDRRIKGCSNRPKSMKELACLLQA